MTFRELLNTMEKFNKEHDIKRKVDTKQTEDGRLIEIVGRIVISNKALNREYPIENRTYEFNNYNKALTSGDGGYSIFAYCKADNDCMRIERLNGELVESAEIVYIVE